MVSIHASRVGGDLSPTTNIRTYTFQSTPPVWEATSGLHHAALLVSFNPRLPCGRRRWRYCVSCAIKQFQSTPPVWEATTTFSYYRKRYGFQSTPPVWEATKIRCGDCHPGKFQSTPPVWEATGDKT